MALKRKESISTDSKRPQPLSGVPVFYKVDLEKHKRDPRVRERLERVAARLRQRD